MVIVTRRFAAALAAAVVALGVLLSLAGPAAGQEEAEQEEAEQEEAAEQLQGTLRDGAREPVAGVAISVATAEGEELGATETADDGTWSVPLPGPGAYVATLDVESLPDGIDLRSPDRNPFEVDISPGQARPVLFALDDGSGAGGAPTSSFLGELLQRLLAGIRFGLIIAITALGLSLIFGTTGLVNFAHGELVTFGAVIAWWLNNPDNLGLQLIAAAAVAMFATSLLGGGVELGIFRPLRARRTGLVQMLVISIGLALFLRFSLLIAFGGNRRPYFDFTLQQPIVLGPLRITPRDLAIMAVATLVLVGVATLLQRSRTGKAMRAVSDNRDLAESSGIDVKRVILIVWIVGGLLAGLGGVLYGMAETVSYLLGFRLLLLMFAGVILGGLGTAYGAMVGSLVVGLVTELSVLWAPTELKFVWALVALIVILLVRPQGLLGRRERIG